MINLLEETQLTLIPTSESLKYSTGVIATVARVLAERVTLGSNLGEVIEEVAGELSPWTPVHSKDGKMAKRMSNFMYKKYGVEIDSDFINALANYLGADTPSSGILYDISKAFDWNDGEFGDGRSCFLSDSTTVRMLRKGGGAAIRFYSGTLSSPKGAARALVFPSSAGVPLVCNAYGATLQQIRSRLEAICDYQADIRYVSAYNEKPVTVNLKTGLLVSEKGKNPEYVKLPVTLVLDMTAINSAMCDGCKTPVPQGALVSANGRQLCNACFHKEYERCSYSGRWLPKDDVVSVQLTGGYNHRGIHDEGLSEYKIGKRYLDAIKTCFECKRQIHPGNVISASHEGDAKTLCHPCSRKLGFTVSCRRCGLALRQGQRCHCRA